MPVVVHGAAGMSLEASTWGGRDGARRGAYFERVVGAALEQWLDSRPAVTHLFHDVSDLARVPGTGMKPLHLGSMNIDHVVLAGSTWLLVDAKGVGEGVLRLVDGVGGLERKDGTHKAQPWMDDVKAYSRAGALFRMTNRKEGTLVTVIPDHTDCDPSIISARFLDRGGSVVTPSQIMNGDLEQLLTGHTGAVDPLDVARIAARCSSAGSNAVAPVSGL